jgi:hypothetical protein
VCYDPDDGASAYLSDESVGIANNPSWPGLASFQKQFKRYIRDFPVRVACLRGAGPDGAGGADAVVFVTPLRLERPFNTFVLNDRSTY